MIIRWLILLSVLLGVTALGILALGGPSPSAHAGCEPVVTTLPTTLSNVSGIAYDGTSLWVTVDLEGLICQVAPDTGAVKRKIQFASHKIGGNAWDGSYLWQLAYEDKTISRIDLNTGQVTAVIATPGTGMCSGMTFDGQYLWVANFDEEKIYQIDQNRQGKILKAVDGNYEITGLAWDGRCLWNGILIPMKTRNEEIPYMGFVQQRDPVTQETLKVLAVPGVTGGTSDWTAARGVASKFWWYDGYHHRIVKIQWAAASSGLHPAKAALSLLTLLVVGLVLFLRAGTPNQAIK